MPRICVISDTHDRYPEAIAEEAQAADEIWHLGDVTHPAVYESLYEYRKPTKIIRGNCDSEVDWPLSQTFECGGLHVHLVHIPPAAVEHPEYDLLLHGHTHRPRDEKIGRTRFLNPGSVGNPNKGAPASFARLIIEDGKAGWKIFQPGSLGRRHQW